jgi:hypothetical protein
MSDYQDTDGDGYPENREVNGKGRKRALFLDLKTLDKLVEETHSLQVH